MGYIQRSGVQPVQPPEVPEYSAGSGPGSGPVQDRFGGVQASGSGGVQGGVQGRFKANSAEFCVPARADAAPLQVRAPVGSGGGSGLNRP